MVSASMMSMLSKGVSALVLERDSMLGLVVDYDTAALLLVLGLPIVVTLTMGLILRLIPSGKEDEDPAEWLWWWSIK